MYLHDFLHSFLPADIVEGGFSHYQLICQHPNAPNIYTIVIALPIGNFGADIVQRAAVSGSPILADGTPSKVTQLAHILQ